MGKAAVELALAGKNSVMPTIVRRSSHPYLWEVGSVALSEVANVEKMMPPAFITEDGFGITRACREYLTPLIQGEDYPPYKGGLPDYVTLKNAPVPKKLPEFEL
jgi:6-phosphofructokinase 1